MPAVQCSALIGRNGQGKSILMSLLIQAHRSSYASGEVIWHMPFAYLSQIERLSDCTLAEALNIADLHASFQRIEQSTASFEDYDRVEHAWHQPTEWLKLLESASTYRSIQLSFSNE